MVLVLAACAHRPPAPPAPPPATVEPSAEARAFYLRVEVATATGDWAEAERAAAWLPRLDGQDAWAFVRVADLALRGGRTDDARSAAEQALALDPELPEAHRVAGLAALAAGDAAAALPHLERARGLPEADDALIRALLATCRLAEAERRAAELTRDDPRWRDALAELAAARTRCAERG